MNKVTPTLTRISVIVGLTLGAFALSALADWTQPHSVPPTCVTDPASPNYDAGCNAPIHVGIEAQYKNGPLGIGAATGLPAGVSLDVFGTAVINNLFTGNATTSTFTMTRGAADGKVLTSDASGNASWQTAVGGGGGSGAVTKIIAGTNITISPITGIGNVTINAVSKPASGTVGGACYHGYLNGSATQLKWFSSGNATYDGGAGACTCPSAYTLMQIGTNATGAGGAGGEAYLCLAK